MTTKNIAILESKQRTFAIYGDKFPDFWGKGTAPCSADPDVFFPEGRGADAKEKQVAKFCQGCPYIKECLQFALENDEWGVWGGTTRLQRKPMREALGYV